MFITTQNEITSLMPTARWERPDQLKGYLEEEEAVALEPLLGTSLYLHLLDEYKRLKELYVDITSSTVTPRGEAREDPGVPYASVTERLEQIHHGSAACGCGDMPFDEEMTEVPDMDLKTIQLIRICQRIEFYKMLSHNGWLLTLSFNEGGGMNVVTAEGYDEASVEKIDKAEKEAFMKAGRAIDSLLLFLETDAKGDRLFTELWQEADAFYLHKDLLFQTARVLNEYLSINGVRMTYVQLVRDIRFCQNTYLKPRIGAKLLKAVIDFANEGVLGFSRQEEENDGTPAIDPQMSAAYDELLSQLRMALAFYVESRRTEAGPKQERMARRDSMTDAQQAMAAACKFIEDNLEALGDAAVGTPIYNAVRARETQAEQDAANADMAHQRMCRERMRQNRKKLFTAFPATHTIPELKKV